MRIRKGFILVILMSIVTIPAMAEIKNEDMGRKILVTEGQQLITQFDIVSLYLSSERVKFEPALTENRKINVEITVLDKRLTEDSGALYDFVSREIAVFKSELSERLQTVAPSIASHFDPNNDIVFEINKGTGRSPVALVSEGNWHWIKGGKDSSVLATEAEPANEGELAKPKFDDTSETAKSEELSSTRQANATENQASCNCPSLKKKK